MNNDRRILVVDDDANLRKTITEILRLKGYDAVAMGTGTEGVAEAARDFVNVALIDLKLPDMSGIDVMERIKLATPLCEVIILTGHASLDTAIEAINKGAFSYLMKPYEMDDLLLQIRHAIERQKGQWEILRLASFPRLDPNPVIEVNSAGEVTYLNPAAERLFPEQTAAQPGLGVLADIHLATESGEQQSVREVCIGRATFEQYLHPVPDTDRIRIYMVDISERKEQEVKLRQLNLLLLTLRNIHEYLMIAENEEALYRFVCEALKGIEDMVGIIVAIKQPDFVLKPVAWAGFNDELISSISVRWDDSAQGGGLMGIVARDGKPAVAADIENDPRYSPWREIVQTWKVRSSAAAPLIADGETMGVLALYSSQRNAFDEEISKFLAEVAIDIAVGVRALRLDKRLHATLENMRKSLYGTVEAIMRMVELRDPDAVGHARRVAQLACAIGNEMGLPERQVEGLRVSGYLHDIGMIAVPTEVLTKLTVLSDSEGSMVKVHPLSGYDILKNLDFPWPVAEIVLQHQERLDGSGYPRGLKGEAIILEARILMVADLVGAMVSHRPYRESPGLEAALNELTANRGKLYDPDVVDACLRLFAEHRFSFDGP